LSTKLSTLFLLFGTKRSDDLQLSISELFSKTDNQVDNSIPDIIIPILPDRSMSFPINLSNGQTVFFTTRLIQNFKNYHLLNNISNSNESDIINTGFGVGLIHDLSISKDQDASNTPSTRKISSFNPFQYNIPSSGINSKLQFMRIYHVEILDNSNTATPSTNSDILDGLRNGNYYDQSSNPNGFVYLIGSNIDDGSEDDLLSTGGRKSSAGKQRKSLYTNLNPAKFSKLISGNQVSILPIKEFHSTINLQLKITMINIEFSIANKIAVINSIKENEDPEVTNNKDEITIKDDIFKPSIIGSCILSHAIHPMITKQDEDSSFSLVTFKGKISLESLNPENINVNTIGIEGLEYVNVSLILSLLPFHDNNKDPIVAPLINEIKTPSTRKTIKKSPRKESSIESKSSRSNNNENAIELEAQIKSLQDQLNNQQNLEEMQKKLLQEQVDKFQEIEKSKQEQEINHLMLMEELQILKSQVKDQNDVILKSKIPVVEKVIKSSKIVTVPNNSNEKSIQKATVELVRSQLNEKKELIQELLIDFRRISEGYDECSQDVINLNKSNLDYQLLLKDLTFKLSKRHSAEIELTDFVKETIKLKETISFNSLSRENLISIAKKLIELIKKSEKERDLQKKILTDGMKSRKVLTEEISKYKVNLYIIINLMQFINLFKIDING
jgi:hypothetical protein